MFLLYFFVFFVVQMAFCRGVTAGKRTPVTIRSALLIVATEADPVLDESIDSVRAIFRDTLPGLFFVEECRVASDRYLIEDILRRWCDEEDMDFVLTIGGTFPAPGHSGEQIAPEATAAVLERTMPSLPEAMRVYAVEEAPDALLDRSVAGIRARTLILNLPGPALLARLFAEAIADLIGPIVARLQPREQANSRLDVVPTLADEPVSSPPAKPKGTGLNADEFAAFLAARRGK